MGNPQYSGGEAGYIGIATESRPDQPVAGPTTPPTAALVATVGVVDAGTHAYVKTDVTALGESLPTAASNVITSIPASNGQVNLTTVAVGAAGVIARKIYRSKAGTGAAGPFFLLTTLANNTATTYTDNTLDSALGAVAPSVSGQNGIPGVYVAPTQFLMAETNTFDETPAPIERDVYGANRDSDQGHSLGKSLTGGNVGLGAYYNNGFELLVAAVGKDVGVTAIVSDTTVSITNSGGMSILNLSAGTGAYQNGMIVFVGPVDATQEVRLVAGWDGVGKNLTVPLLRKVHSSAGTAVVSNFQHKVMPLVFADTGHLQLRTISVTDVPGGKYGNCYPGQLVGEYGLKGDASKFEVTANMMGSFDRFLANGQNGTPVPAAFVEDLSWDDISFEFTDGFACFPWDSQDTGTATMQLVADVDAFELKFNNTLLAHPTFDGQDTTRHFAMKREILFTFSTINPASYPQIWTNFLKRQINLPFFLQCVKNIGTVNVPIWRAMVIYMPNVRVKKAPEAKGLTQVVGEGTIECKAIRGGGLEKIYIFMLNDFAAAV